jgi:hypothetical protein
MEITLEKIELVKDRTGVSYKEAKEALEAADGNVVNAIISIEENINLTGAGKVSDQARVLLERVKEAVNKGNIARIRISRGGESILNLPVNIGIVGTVLAPWAAVFGVIAAFGTKCKIELVKVDGEIIDVSERAEDKFGDIADKGSDIADVVKEKGANIYGAAKNKVQDVAAKRKGPSAANEFKDTVDEMWEEAKRRVERAEDAAAESDDPETEDGDKPGDA